MSRKGTAYRLHQRGEIPPKACPGPKEPPPSKRPPTARDMLRALRRGQERRQ